MATLRGRHGITTAFGAALLTLGVAGLAWACTPQARITIAPNSGPAGAVTRVEGGAFHEGPVEIRWDSSTGPLLGTATGPSFAVDITIPEARTGTHYVVAVAAGTIYKATAPFTLTSESGSPPPPAGDEGGGGQTTSTTSGGDQPSGKNSGSASGGNTASGGGQSSSGASGGDDSGRSGSDSGSTSGGATGAGTGSPSGSVSGGSASSSGNVHHGSTEATWAAGTLSGTSRAVVDTSGRLVFAGSIAPIDAFAGETRVTEAPGRLGTAADLSSVGDLWSGFDTGSAEPGYPSLTDPAPGLSGRASHLVVGIALLGAGLVTLVGGSLIAPLRDRPDRAFETIEAATACKPDVVLLDYWMEDMEGAAATRLILKRAPIRKVILLSWFHGTNEIDKALTAGASGFFPKSLPLERLVDGVRRAHGGESPVLLDELENLFRTISRRASHAEALWRRVESLSNREVAVLTLLSTDRSVAEIAQELTLSPHTIKVHIRNILHKTGAASRREAIALARACGLIRT